MSGVHQRACVNASGPTPTAASNSADGPFTKLPVATPTTHNTATSATVNGARRNTPARPSSEPEAPAAHADHLFAADTITSTSPGRDRDGHRREARAIQNAPTHRDVSLLT